MSYIPIFHTVSKLVSNSCNNVPNTTTVKTVLPLTHPIFEMNPKQLLNMRQPNFLGGKAIIKRKLDQKRENVLDEISIILQERSAE